jgi:hypothetical protein
MLLDLENLFSDEQDLSQTVASYLSTNTVDLGATATPVVASPLKSDVGQSRIDILVQVIEAFTSANSTATVQFQVVMADDAALSSNLVVAQETPAIVVTALTQGYRAALSVPKSVITKRYLGVRYVIGVQTTTAGTCTAGLLLDRP